MKNPIFGLILAGAVSAAALAATSAIAQDDVPSLKGKTIGVTSIGNEHYWNIKAFQGAIDEIKRLGGTPIGLDAGYVDSKQIVPDPDPDRPEARRDHPGARHRRGDRALVQEDHRRRHPALHPRHGLDAYASTSRPPTICRIGEELALKLVSDIGGEGNILVFNGFYGVTPVAIRYDQLKKVLKYYPKIKIIDPELKEVIPNTVQDAQTQITESSTNTRRARSRRSGRPGTSPSSARRRRSSPPAAPRSRPTASTAGPKSSRC